MTILVSKKITKATWVEVLILLINGLNGRITLLRICCTLTFFCISWNGGVIEKLSCLLPNFMLKVQHSQNCYRICLTKCNALAFYSVYFSPPRMTHMLCPCNSSSVHACCISLNVFPPCILLYSMWFGKVWCCMWNGLSWSSVCWQQMSQNVWAMHSRMCHQLLR